MTIKVDNWHNYLMVQKTVITIELTSFFDWLDISDIYFGYTHNPPVHSPHKIELTYSDNSRATIYQKPDSLVCYVENSDKTLTVIFKYAYRGV